MGCLHVGQGIIFCELEKNDYSQNDCCFCFAVRETNYAYIIFLGLGSLGGSPTF
jgi:hypothetical protein